MRSAGRSRCVFWFCCSCQWSHCLQLVQLGSFLQQETLFIQGTHQTFKIHHLEGINQWLNKLSSMHAMIVFRVASGFTACMYRLVVWITGNVCAERRHLNLQKSFYYASLNVILCFSHFLRGWFSDSYCIKIMRSRHPHTFPQVDKVLTFHFIHSKLKTKLFDKPYSWTRALLEVCFICLDDSPCHRLLKYLISQRRWVKMTWRCLCLSIM